MSVDTWRLPPVAFPSPFRGSVSRFSISSIVTVPWLSKNDAPSNRDNIPNTPSLDRSHALGNPGVQYYRTWEQALGIQLAHATAAARPFLPCTEQPRRHIPDLAIVSSAIGPERSIPLTSRTRVSRTPITIWEGFDSHLFPGQGPTAVDIKTTKKLAEPMLEPSPLPTHPLQPQFPIESRSWPEPTDACPLPEKLPAIYRPMLAEITHPVATNTSDFLPNYRHALPLHRNECRTQAFVGSKPGHPAPFVPDSVSDLLSLLLQTLAVNPPLSAPPAVSNQPSPLQLQ
ncbi:hypothetical protein FPRO05_10760 [Fusarium proliferatum]|uniref:Uncharacterized protein n=1 Tax=Gibberella intermedia TaxID=948311 RepID=A0A365NCC4_GIBIN|nr:hypothetical protein FPRO05_10760 [Fusarium proliferatum]